MHHTGATSPVWLRSDVVIIIFFCWNFFFFPLFWENENNLESARKLFGRTKQSITLNANYDVDFTLEWR